MSNLYKSYGYLHYGEEWKLIVKIDQDISNYYRSLIPKYMEVYPQMWPAHITVVRVKREVPTIIKPWKKYDGQPIEFLYSPIIYWDEKYYWLDVYCKALELIRKELGLPYVSQYTLPPSGFKKVFHITIGNKKA